MVIGEQMLFSFWKKPAFEERLATLQSELRYFNPLIGGWPTKIKDEIELRNVRGRWNEAAKLAQGLLKDRPNSIEAKVASGTLLRMGHNIDVPDAAQMCYELLYSVINQEPRNYAAHFNLACFYVSVNPEYAPKAEQHFLLAESIIAPQVVPDIYQGLGYACWYQEKVQDAIHYFEKYLSYVDDDDDDGIRYVLDKLKSGDVGKTIFVEPKNDAA